MRFAWLACLVIATLFTNAIAQSESSKKSEKPKTEQQQKQAESKPAEPVKAQETPSEPSKPDQADKDERYDMTEVPPVVTHHQIATGGQTLKYTATAGRLPIKRGDGKIEAEMFFVAYTLDGQDLTRRPVTFAFNGGPGSASVWLHMGALGPKRVLLQPGGFMPAAPYHAVDNAYTALDKTDLVLVDAIGTGFSRAANLDTSKKFWGVKGDIQAFGEFIRLYITRYERWTSPLYLLGESYGTT